MLDYVYNQKQIVADFAAQLIPHCRRGFGPNIVAMGVVDVHGAEAALIAGFVYHNYDPEAAIMEISGAALPGINWLTRETLARIYQYPFLRCDCQMIIQRVPSDNERLLYQLSRLNYAFARIERLFGRDRDGVVCTLTRERWQANKFNQRLKHHLDVRPPVEEAA